MNFFFTTIIVGICLSMDAFSLSLVYGTMGISKTDKFLLAFIVSLYHFFMPLIGYFIGFSISGDLFVSSSFVLFVIFSIIGIMMIFSSFKENGDIYILKSIWSYLVFGLSVSIDSLTVGLGFNIVSNNILYSSIVFSMCSFFFTLMGLIFGGYLNMRFGKYSTFFGGAILITLALFYLF